MIEKHPLKPFLPENASILMLGSFPPPQARWSMDFFYPNFTNDMWRIFGSVFFGNPEYFITSGDREKRRIFDKDRISAFCSEKGIALYDSASEVIRQKENASDKYLQVVRETDISTLLEMLPKCRTIVATGDKAAEIISRQIGCSKPSPGEKVVADFCGRRLHFYRMPSSSRAYPLPLTAKAEIYRRMFSEEI